MGRKFIITLLWLSTVITLYVQSIIQLENIYKNHIIENRIISLFGGLKHSNNEFSYITIVDNTSSSIDIEYILANIHMNRLTYSLATDNLILIPKFENTCDYLILLINHPDDGINLIKQRLNLSFNGRYTFFNILIVIDQVLLNLESMDELMKLHSFMVTKEFSNCVLMIRFSMYTNIQIITFNSYVPNVMVNLTGTTPTISELFRDLNRDMHGQSLRITFYDDYPRSFAIGNEIKGVEGWLIRLVCERFNGTYQVFNSSSVRSKFKDAQFNAILNLVYNRSDLNLNLQRQNKVGITATMFNTYPRKIDKLVVLLATQERPNNLLESIKCFDIGAIYLYLIVTIIMISSCLICRKIQRLQTSVVELIINVFGSAFMVSVNHRQDSGYDKLFVTATLWISFIMYSCYQTFMISNLIQIHYKQFLFTFEELNISGIELVITHMMDLNIMVDQSRIPIERLIHNLDNSVSIYDSIANKSFMRYGFIVSETEADIILGSSWNMDGRRKRFYKLTEPIGEAYLSYSMMRLTPFYLHFETVLERIFESGLETYWTTRAKHEFIMANFTQAILKLEDVDYKLSFTFDNFRNNALIVVYIGWTFSFIVFLAEIIAGKIFCVKNK